MVTCLIFPHSARFWPYHFLFEWTEKERGTQCWTHFWTHLCVYIGRRRQLLEEAYVMKDPFTPDKDKFLITGSCCSLCSRHCSLFYSEKFCFPCVKENQKAFPLEIQEEMDKREPQASEPCPDFHICCFSALCCS
uniref:Cysteine-rich DPF motif domain-containing protein 1 n=1 Tax=Malurus cyaneus samueli TaxID=2593467 RepID=A0A8C5U9V9_9PASS